MELNKKEKPVSLILILNKMVQCQILGVYSTQDID